MSKKVGLERWGDLRDKAPAKMGEEKGGFTSVSSCGIFSAVALCSKTRARLKVTPCHMEKKLFR